MRRLIVSLCFFLLTAPLIAQEETSTIIPGDSWTLEQRCVGEATTPPDDWTFEGTIFTYNIAQDLVRGFRADFPTTYVLSQGGNHFGFAGAISPDGKWFAVPVGEEQRERNMAGDSSYSISEVRIYETTPAVRLVDVVEWEAVYLFVSRSSGIYGIDWIEWVDNETFFYASGWHGRPRSYQLVKPFEDKIETWNAPFEAEYAVLSPDLQRAVKGGLYNTRSGEEIIELNVDHFYGLFAHWSPDSEQVSFFENWKLYVVDRDGETKEEIADINSNSFSMPQQPIWSSNNQFAFTFGADFPLQTLYVVDITTRTITDLCLGAYTAAWSPDGRYLAFDRSQKGLYILDTDLWEYYRVGEDTGDVRGWYPNEKTER